MKKAIAMMMILALALSLMGVASAETQRVSKPFRIPRVLRHVESTVEPEAPAAEPTEEPAEAPAEEPAAEPTEEPVVEPVEAPTEEPAAEPTEAPVVEPTEEPVVEPTAEPTAEPADEPLSIAAIVKLDNEKSTLFVRKSADASSDRVAKLHNGDRVTILAYDGDWARILFDNCREGYVFAAYLTTEPVEEPAAEPTEAPAEEPAAAITAKGDADVRVAADGLSEIFATLPDGTVLNLLAVEGDWAKVDVDGQVGYIYKDSVSGVEWPQTEPTEAIDEENMKVTIFTSRRTVVEPGETITLTSRLEGFENCEIVVYQWQYDRGNGFEDIPGADADTYAFAADVETLSYDWRLVVYYA